MTLNTIFILPIFNFFTSHVRLTNLPCLQAMSCGSTTFKYNLHFYVLIASPTLANLVSLVQLFSNHIRLTWFDFVFILLILLNCSQVLLCWHGLLVLILDEFNYLRSLFKPRYIHVHIATLVFASVLDRLTEKWTTNIKDHPSQNRTFVWTTQFEAYYLQVATIFWALGPPPHFNSGPIFFGLCIMGQTIIFSTFE